MLQNSGSKAVHPLGNSDEPLHLQHRARDCPKSFEWNPALELFLHAKVVRRPCLLTVEAAKDSLKSILLLDINERNVQLQKTPLFKWMNHPGVSNAIECVFVAKLGNG